MERPRLKPIALPAEHGGWALVGAPVTLGCAVFPTSADLAIGVMAFGAFLARQPLRLAFKDLLAGKQYPRTRWAAGFALGYLVLAAAGACGGLVLARGAWGWPLALALPLFAFQAVQDYRSKGREPAAEICGAVAASSIAAAMILGDGLGPEVAGFAWLGLAIKEVATIAYVRERLGAERGNVPNRILPISLHLPLLALHPIGAVLLLRAAWGLSPWRNRLKTSMVGATEVFYSLFWVCVLAYSLTTR